MATAVAEEVQKKTKSYALEVEHKIKDIIENQVPLYWEMARLFSEVHKKGLWQILGHESERKYQESLLVSRSSWFEKRRVWESWAELALKNEKITTAQLKRMGSQNVKQLLRLEDKRMFASNWINKALHMKESELEAHVDHAIRNEDEPEEGLGKKDSRAVLKIECTNSQKTFILEGLEEFRSKNLEDLPDKDNTAAILESFIADWRAGA